jgi:Uma2 family endonuclease
VLSPSSAGDDDGDKRADFQSLATVEAYVIVSQDRRFVKIYRRGEGAGWRTETCRDGQHFALPALTAPIPVEEVYRNILDSDGRSLLRSL